MKVAVIGSRSFTDYEKMCQVLDQYHITEIISGGAKGADSLAGRYATEHKLLLTESLPDWFRYGRAAGMIRNSEIVIAAEIVIAFWDGTSRGTADSIKKARKFNKKVHIIS
jgi:hypothetical protein